MRSLDVKKRDGACGRGASSPDDDAGGGRERVIVVSSPVLGDVRRLAREPRVLQQLQYAGILEVLGKSGSADSTASVFTLIPTDETVPPAAVQRRSSP